MKRLKYALIAIVFLWLSVSQTGCIGSFQLTSNLYEWNRNNVGGKWGSELVFLAFIVLPVYQITLLADGIVLNSIEFWTGENPISMKPGEKDTRIVRNGEDIYRLTAEKDRMGVEKIGGSHAGEKGEFIYDSEESNWEFISQDQHYDLE